MADCPICCCKFNAKVRKQITCALCKANVCQSCFTHYLMDKKSNEADCMFCHEHVSLEFVNLHTSAGFRRKYKNKLVDELFADEETKLEDTIQMVKEERNICATVLFRYNMFGPEPRDGIIEDLYDRYALNEHTPTASATNTFPCPAADCHGAVSKGACMLCQMNVCEKCREEKREDHACDRDTLATVTLIRTSTKPCPKCGVKIYKIDGCDQMFCTKCHTAFSWNTGTIERRYIHNPHYFEWQRQNVNACVVNYEPRDYRVLEGCPPEQPRGPCLPSAFSRLAAHSLAARDRWYQLVEESRFIVHALGDRLTERQINRDRLSMRRKYVLLHQNKPDGKKRWKLKLAKHLTLINLSRDLMLILDMFPDLFFTIVTESTTMAEVEHKYSTTLRVYMNTQFSECCKRHGSKANVTLNERRFLIPAMFKVYL